MSTLRTPTGLLLGTLLLAAAACAPGPSTAPDATRGASSQAPAVSPAPTPLPSPDSPASAAPSPTPGSGFAFGADAVMTFYANDGFTCGEPAPSAGAEDWTVRSCERTDEAGRRLGVGVVTDPQGALGDGFASVTAAAGEDVVTPEDALDHLSGFLGAMVGETRATELLPWLAGSMGNPYEETTSGELRVATYLEPRDDPTTIWLEVAGPGYLDAPAP